MPWSSGLKRFIRTKPVTLKASAAETATTVGTAVEFGDASSAIITCDVTVVTGTTPTMTVKIEGSDDNTNFGLIGTFGTTFTFAGGTAPTNLTATATVRVVVPAARWMRYSSVIGGTTPSFTYSVSAVAYGASI